MVSRLETLVFANGVHLLSVLEYIAANKCLKNDDIGSRSTNVYYCEDPEHSECCEDGGEFKCCEPGSVRNLREQLQLWGSVCVILLIIGVLYLLFRRDGTIVSGSHIAESCLCFRCCRQKKSVSLINSDEKQKLVKPRRKGEIRLYSNRTQRYQLRKI